MAFDNELILKKNLYQSWLSMVGKVIKLSEEDLIKVGKHLFVNIERLTDQQSTFDCLKCNNTWTDKTTRTPLKLNGLLMEKRYQRDNPNDTLHFGKK